jgi:hypothetical protein
MVVWSIVGSAQYYLKGRTSFLICRALLGMLQGGFIPEASILYLTIEYTLIRKSDHPVPVVLLQAP